MVRVKVTAVIFALTTIMPAVAADAPKPDAVAKLVAQLNSADFRVRQDASDRLIKLGGPALPVLRRALTGNAELEAKRRIEFVIGRIENGLLQVELKLWEEIEPRRRSFKDRILKVYAKTPTLSDESLTSAVYLLISGRSATDEEVKRVQTQFAQSHCRAIGVLRLARELVDGKEYQADLASANRRILKIHKSLASDANLSESIARLNGEECFKTISDAAEAGAQATRNDKQFLDLAVLMTLSRYPTAQEAKQGLAHLTAGRARKGTTADIFWALMNTREFVSAK